jgi:hypothetical protein
MVLNNKRGQSVVVGIMIAVIVLIFLFQIINPIKSIAQGARNDLDCTNTSISTGTKATCILVDWYTFYFIGLCLAAGVSMIIIKRAWS